MKQNRLKLLASLYLIQLQALTQAQGITSSKDVEIPYDCYKRSNAVFGDTQQATSSSNDLVSDLDLITGLEMTKH